MRRPWVIAYLLLGVIGGLVLLAISGALIEGARGGELVFAREPVLFLLLAGALMAWVGFHLARNRVPTLAFSRTAELAAAASRGPRVWLASLPRVLRIVAIGLIVVCLAEPQGKRRTEIEVEGIDMMIVLDMSRSMEDHDLRRDRLDAAQRTIRKFLRGRKNDRIGLVVFGKEAMLQTPLTLDYHALDRIVADLQLGDIDGEGTAIGDGLGLALASLRRSDARSKVILLITDGDSNTVNQMAPDEAKDVAKKLGVRIFAVLMGEELGASSPYRGRAQHGTNPALLKRIAHETNHCDDCGYYNAGNDDALNRGFEHVRATLDKDKRRIVGESVDELYPGLALAALWFLLAELALSLTWLRRWP
jgi:Ca-activated chloride channel family protein